jgi:uncharacterized protein
MGHAPATMEAVPAVRISADGLVATLALPEGLPTIGPTQLAKALKTAAIHPDAVQRASLDPANPDAAFLPGAIIARGLAPIDDTPARIDLPHLHAVDPTGKSPVDYRALSSLIIVCPGQRVAEAIAYAKGADGLDVRGRPLPHRKEPNNKISLGKGLAYDKDGIGVLAQAAGELHCQGLKLWIEPRLEITGDIDFSVGNINYDGDVAIGGSIRDLFKVHVQGHVTVNGSVDAAEVICGGTLTVNLGINARGKGHCIAHGGVVAKHISNATIRAHGDIAVLREIHNSRLIGFAQLLLEHGALLGGHATILGDALCHTLGSEAAVRTLIEVGLDQRLREFTSVQAAKLNHLARELAALQQELALLQPRPGKTPSPAQLARIAELEAALSQQHALLDPELAILRARLAHAIAPPAASLTVESALHPGVEIHLGPYEIKVAKLIRGPLIIRPAATPPGTPANTPGLIMVNPATGSLFNIDHHPYTDPALATLRHFLHNLPTIAPA